VKSVTHPLPFSFFWETLTYPPRKSPLMEGGLAQEEGFPWRTGKCRVFRAPFSRQAFAIGRWTGEQPRENVDGIPSLSFRPLDHPEDFYHVQEDPTV
jgi:hypothetical protein